MTARECADEQEQRQSRVQMSKGDGQCDNQVASVTASQCDNQSRVSAS